MIFWEPSTNQRVENGHPMEFLWIEDPVQRPIQHANALNDQGFLSRQMHSSFLRLGADPVRIHHCDCNNSYRVLLESIN